MVLTIYVTRSDASDSLLTNPRISSVTPSTPVTTQQFVLNSLLGLSLCRSFQSEGTLEGVGHGWFVLSMCQYMAKYTSLLC